MGRNTLDGPGVATLDLRWSHDLVLKKGKGAEGPAATIGLDAFNVLNHVNFAGYVGNLSSPFFGQAIAALPPRRLQLTAGYKF